MASNPRKNSGKKATTATHTRKKPSSARKQQQEAVLRREQKNREILGVIFILTGILLILTNFVFSKGVGGSIDRFFMGTFGILGRFVGFILVFLGVYTIAVASKDNLLGKAALFCGALLCLCGIFHVKYSAEFGDGTGFFAFLSRAFEIGSTQFDGGGFFGALISYPIIALTKSSLITYIVLLGAIFILIIAFTNLSLQQAGVKVAGAFKKSAGSFAKMQESHATKRNEEKEERARLDKMREEILNRPSPIDLDDLVYASIANEVPSVQKVPAFEQAQRKRRSSHNAGAAFNIEVGEPPRRRTQTESSQERTLPKNSAKGMATVVHDPVAVEAWNTASAMSYNMSNSQGQAQASSYDWMRSQAQDSLEDELDAAMQEDGENSPQYDAASENITSHHNEQPQSNVDFPLAPEQERFLPRTGSNRTRTVKAERYPDIDLSMGEREENTKGLWSEPEILNPTAFPQTDRKTRRQQSNKDNKIVAFPQTAKSNVGNFDLRFDTKDKSKPHVEDSMFTSERSFADDSDHIYDESLPPINDPDSMFDDEIPLIPDDSHVDFKRNDTFDDEYEQWESETNHAADKSNRSSSATEQRQIYFDNEEDDDIYIPPSLNLLNKAKPAQHKPTEDIERKAEQLEETLRSFGIQAKVVHYESGPTLTRFAVQLAPGVRINKVVNLGDDIAMNLGVSHVRVSTIPSRNAVGIELPNQKTTPVMLEELLRSDSFRQNNSRLAVALGKDITGQAVVADLSRMPHLLIAGSTGSGKSVCINSILCSILYHSSPEDVRMILVDPKVVELAAFSNVPHLLIPVVTNPNKAATALNKAVAEMENRYHKFAALNVRDLARYNQTVANQGGYIAVEGSEYEHEHLPQIVIIIDELADLMMVAAKEVEEAICRIAQMGRAAGIHLVLATQRPSTNIITGLIKANVPSRIAFAVASSVDSRIILDANGAEKLLGRGDMLFSPIGSNEPTRIQGALVTDEEVERIREHFIETTGPGPQFDEEFQNAVENGVAIDQGQVMDDMDELLPETVELVMQNGTASVSMLQRRFRIGFARAGRIVDSMEQLGIVAPADPKSNKPREVTFSRERFEQMFGYPPQIPPMGT